MPTIKWYEVVFLKSLSCSCYLCETKHVACPITGEVSIFANIANIDQNERMDCQMERKVEGPDHPCEGVRGKDVICWPGNQTKLSILCQKYGGPLDYVTNKD